MSTNHSEVQEILGRILDPNSGSVLNLQTRIDKLIQLQQLENQSVDTVRVKHALLSEWHLPDQICARLANASISRLQALRELLRQISSFTLGGKIAAVHLHQPSASNRRRHPRYRTGFPVSLFQDGRQYHAVLRDISEGGASLSGYLPRHAETGFILNLPRQLPYPARRIPVSIVRHDKNAIGVSFELPISSREVSKRCDASAAIPV